MKTIQKRLRRLAVDMDGVLSNTHNLFVDFFNQRHKTGYTPENLTSYKFWEVLQVSEKELSKDMTDFYRSPFFKKITPLQDSIEAIRRLQRSNLLYVVTSRPDTIRRETAAWLMQYFPDAFLRVHFTRKYGGNGAKEKKSDFCLEYGYEIIIEDVAEYANECAERGIGGFILTQPWNKEERLHPRVNRVRDWEELLQHLE